MRRICVILVVFFLAPCWLPLGSHVEGRPPTSQFLLVPPDEFKSVDVKHSLEPPFSFERDQSRRFVYGNWTLGFGHKGKVGEEIVGGATDEAPPTSLLRLTSIGQPSHWGVIWNSEPVRMEDWEVDIQFGIEGRVKHKFPGDGLIVWLTNRAEIPSYYEEAPLSISNLGKSPDFLGVAIVVDTGSDLDLDFTRKNKDEEEQDKEEEVGMESKDYIYTVVRTLAINYGDDTQFKFPGCSLKVRRSLVKSEVKSSGAAVKLPMRLRIRYAREVLSVWTKSPEAGKGNEGEVNWEMCSKFKVSLQNSTNYYLGLSAYTGPLSYDSHDIYSIQTYNITRGFHEYEMESSISSPTPLRPPFLEAEEEDEKVPEMTESTTFKTISAVDSDRNSMVARGVFLFPILVFLAFIAFGLSSSKPEDQEEER